MSAQIVAFTPGGYHSPKECMDPMDLAELDIAQAAHEISQVIYAAQSVNAVLALRQRIGVMVTRLHDVEQFACARARKLHEQEEGQRAHIRQGRRNGSDVR